MGHKWRTQNGERLSPLTILHIIRRVHEGEAAIRVGAEYGVNGSTIGRWAKRWADEARALPAEAYEYARGPVHAARPEGLSVAS